MDQLMSRQIGGSPFLMIPIAVEDPFAFWKCVCEVSNAASHFLRTRRVTKLDAGETLSAGIEMNMRVIKTRHCAAAMKVNDASIGTYKLEDSSRVSHGQDTSIHDSNRLRFRLLQILRPDSSVGQNQGRRAL